MEYELYCVFDSATGMYFAPMAQDNDAVAMRSFAHECMKEDSLWHTHPEDFRLYKVGIFNASTGEILVSPAERVCAATDFVRKEK